MYVCLCVCVCVCYLRVSSWSDLTSYGLCNAIFLLTCNDTEKKIVFGASTCAQNKYIYIYIHLTLLQEAILTFSTGWRGRGSGGGVECLAHMSDMA